LAQAVAAAVALGKTDNGKAPGCDWEVARIARSTGK